MDSQQSGKLILEAVPADEVERAIVTYLSTIAKNTSLEALTAKIRKAPTVLSKNISSSQGMKIAASLRRLGAMASFVPYPSETRASEEKSSAKHPRPLKTEKAQGNPKKNQQIPAPATAVKRKRFRIAAALLLSVLALGLLGWRCYPLLAYWSGYEIEISKPKQLARTDFRTYRSWDSKTPSIMDVAPQDMYEAFRYQYRWRPDKRFIKALEILT
jgi:hypothetical protein